MSELVEALATPSPSFTHEGKEYRFSAVTFDVMAEMTEKLYLSHIKALIPLRPHMEAEAYQKRLEALEAKRHDDEFAFEGKLMEAYLGSLAGMVQICALLLNAPESEVMGVISANKDTISALFAQAKSKSFSPAKRGSAPPKVKARHK